MALADAFSQDTFNVDMGDPVDQSVRDKGKDAALAYIRDKQDDPSPPAGGSVMTVDATSPKRIKKLRTGVSIPRERTRSKSRATKPHNDAPPYDEYMHGGVLEY